MKAAVAEGVVLPSAAGAKQQTTMLVNFGTQSYGMLTHCTRHFFSDGECLLHCSRAVSTQSFGLHLLRVRNRLRAAAAATNHKQQQQQQDVN